jgi:S1-C subfamily serine protease
VQLQQLANTGRLQPTDGIWKAGMGQAVTARTVPGLYASPAEVEPAREQLEQAVQTRARVADVPGSEKAPVADAPGSPQTGAERPPLWKRLLREIGAIGSATARQTVRPLVALHDGWKGRSLRKAAQASKLALGQKAYEAQIGDAKLREQIHSLGEEIHSALVHKKPARQLAEQRRTLLLHLADPLLVQTVAPPDLAECHGRARTAEQEVQAYEDRSAARKRSFPRGAVGWRRVGIGYGLAAGVAAGVLWWLSADSSGILEPGKPPTQEAKKPPNKDKPPAQKPAEKEKTAAREKRPLRDLSSKEIYAASAKSVALIRGPSSSGTGFLVRPRILATNAHVINVSLPSALKVYFPSAGKAGKTALPAKLLYFDGRRDLAFLEVSSKLRPLEVNQSYTFESGEDVTVIGNPAFADFTLKNAVTRGLMSTPTQIKGQDYYQISISVNPGNSGGPVFDSKGQVIGIVTLKARQQEGIAFCIPARDVVQALATLEKATPKAREEMAARQSVIALFQRVVDAGEIYVQGMDALVSIMRRGIPPQAVIARLKPQIDKKLKEIDESLEGVPEAIKDLENNSQLPEEQRQKFVELWNTCQSMKRCLANPNPFQLAQQSRQLEGKFKELVKEVGAGLGVEAPE